MDKYAVLEDAPEEKLAEAKSTSACPKCGSLLSDQSSTGVLHCPRCGTKPFEER